MVKHQNHQRTMEWQYDATMDHTKTWLRQYDNTWIALVSVVLMILKDKINELITTYLSQLEMIKTY